MNTNHWSNYFILNIRIRTLLLFCSGKRGKNKFNKNSILHWLYYKAVLGPMTLCPQKTNLELALKHLTRQHRSCNAIETRCCSARWSASNFPWIWLFLLLLSVWVLFVLGISYASPSFKNCFLSCLLAWLIHSSQAISHPCLPLVLT